MHVNWDQTERIDREMGGHLQRIRDQSGHTLISLSRASGVDVDELADLESGRLPLTMIHLLQIAPAVEMTPTELCDTLLRRAAHFIRSA